MNCCDNPADRPTLAEVTRSAGFAAAFCALLERVSTLDEECEAIALLRQATALMGADAAVFTSLLRDDHTFESQRHLLACDPLWGTDYLQHRWCADDPWLRHAEELAEPVRGSELVLRTPRQCAMVETAARHGFRSTLILPAPSATGLPRLAVLCIGSQTPGYFEGDGYSVVRVLGQPLAMELHTWWHRRIRQQLIDIARITSDDIRMLMHEQQGHGSKIIAADFGTEPKTIDCRFQRLNAKLDAPNRRAAVRVAKLYGLI